MWYFKFHRHRSYQRNIISDHNLGQWDWSRVNNPNKSVKAVSWLKSSFMGKLFLKLIPLTVNNFFIFLQRLFTMVLHPVICVPILVPVFLFFSRCLLLHCPFQHPFCELMKRSSFSLFLQEQLSILHFTPIILLCTSSFWIHFSCQEL